MATKKPSVPLRGPQLLWDQAGEFLPLAPEAAPAVQPQAKRNAFAYANDTAIDIANAATNLAKSGVDLFAPDSAVSARMADFVKSGEESQSDWKKAQRAKLQAELAAADGELAKAGAYIKHAVVDDPLGTVAEAAGNFAPFAVLGRGMQVARMSDAAKIAAGGTTAGALSAGEVRGNIWQRISETPDAVLQQESPEYAQMRANGVSELDAKKAIGASFARNAPELALPAAVGALSGKYGVEAMMAGVAPKMAASRLGAAGLGFAQEGGEGAVEQLATNIALKRAIPSQSLAHDVALNTVAEGLLGVPGGLVAGGPKSTPQGDAIRDTETIPETGTGTFAKALNTATEQRAQIADAGRSVTADEATVSAKARIDELGKKEAGTPDEELPGPNGEPVTVSGTPPQILSAGETQEKQFLEANKDNPAVLAGAKGKVVSPIPGAIDADVALERMRDQLRTDEAIVKAREREADAAHAATLQPQPEPESDAAPAPEPTDILSPSGGPWKAKLAAQKALKSRPDKADLALASVAGGYVLRRKPDAQQPDVHESPPVAAVADAGGSDQPAGSGGPVGPVAVDATGGSAPAAAAPAPSSGEAELLADGGGAPDGAVIDAEAHKAAESPHNDLPTPTDAQKEAGNYKKGHVRIDGMDVSIENPQGSMRRSKADAKDPWEVEMPAHYGYIRGTEGADGDHVDLTIGPKGANGRYWVVNQNTPDGKKFDEHKVFTGVDSAEEATDLYKRSFANNFGDKVFDSISGEMDADTLKAKLPEMRKPRAVEAGETNAQAVRSDEGQVRSGEPSQGATAEGSLRPGAEQGSGDLQQPAPDQAGEHGRQAEVAPTEATRSSEQAKEAAATEAKPERAADNREDAGSTVPAGSPESAQSRSDATLQTVMGMTDEQRRAAIDAESMETRHDAPQVAQPTKGKRVRVIARTLNGIKQVTANLYELPNYNGPQLAVSEYKSSRGHGYRVYLPKSGAFITDSNGVSSLDDTLKLAVLRIHNARQTIASRAPAAEREQSLKTSAEKARWTRAPAADRLGILGRAGWTVNPPSKATERMQRISWDKMSDSQRERISAAMEPAAASEPANKQTELQKPRSSFDRQIDALRDVGARVGWKVAEHAGTDRFILKREDGGDAMRSVFTQLTVSRVTGGRYQVEIARGERGAKRGVNALNIEGEATEFSGHRALNWDGKRGWQSNEIFPVLRDYITNNPAALSDRSFGEPEKPTPDEGKARRTEMVELRKRLSVLEQLRKCL